VYPANQNTEKYYEARRQDFMVDEACPRKSASLSEPMFCQSRTYCGTDKT